MANSGDERGGRYDRPTARSTRQRRHWFGAHVQPEWKDGKGRVELKEKRRETINWTFVGVVGLVAALGGTAVGIGMARDDDGGRAGQIIEDVTSSFTGRFSICHVGGGYNCVVDGDTIWLEGEKIRILGIDAPETHPPRCAREERLGRQATRRLRDLLNSGNVRAIRSDQRDRDSYGRLLRNVEVDGRDVGRTLISEGLARPYGRGRRSWC